MSVRKRGVLMIRRALPSDAAACAGIYNYYIENTTYTFELEPMSEEAFAARIEEVSRFYPFFVWEDEETGRVLGYVYLSAFSPRGAYRFTCDESIYIDHIARGQGIGHALMEAAKEAAEKQGFHTMLAVITSENSPSRRFHEREGFFPDAELCRVAYKMGRWLGIRYYRFALCEDTDEAPEELIPYPEIRDCPQGGLR